MKIKNVLKTKGPEVFTISEDKNVIQAMSFIVANRIGSLIVINNEAKITGIISERDALKVCFENPNNFSEIAVKEVMTKSIIFAEPEDEVDYVLGIMTQNKFRHVPVMKEGSLIGIVSIGDLVKVQLNEMHIENKYLMEYIHGQATTF